MHTSNPEIRTLRAAIVAHPLPSKLTTLREWRIFMEHHVFAVWDFMALLKRLQRAFAGQDVPWLPPAAPRLARFINEIVLVEESDAFGDEYLSHCEIYVRAMKQCGADTRPFETFLRNMASGWGVERALHAAGAPPAVRAFVGFTVDVARDASDAEVCAVFLWGRENLIPDMFAPLAALLEAHGEKTACLRHYLTRHIEIDGEEHGPLAAQMMALVCRREACDPAGLEALAARALYYRLMLWGAIDKAVCEAPEGCMADIGAHAS